MTCIRGTSISMSSEVRSSCPDLFTRTRTGSWPAPTPKPCPECRQWICRSYLWAVESPPRAAIERRGRSATRNDGNNARRKTAAFLGLREAHQHQRAGLGHMVQVRKQLDLEMIGAQNIALKRVIIPGDGKPRIGVGS